MTHVLCLDPGFEWVGWSVVALEHPMICEMGVYRTQKSNKKLNVRDADDNFRRLREIAFQIEHLRAKWSVRAVCMEAYSPVRSSSVGAKLGGVYGILAAICETSKLPCVSISPQETRQRLKAESKDGVASVVRARFIDTASRRTMSVFEAKHAEAKAERVHAWDSLGVFIACESSDVLLALARR